MIIRCTAMTCCHLLVILTFVAPAIADEQDNQFTGDIKVVIFVADVEKSAAFYRDVLGFTFDGFAGDADDPYYAEMLAGPTRFGLHEPTVTGDELRVGQQRVYFRVRNLDAQRQLVETHGIEVPELIERSWMDFFVVEDPDGNDVVFAVTDPIRHTSQPWTNPES